MRRTIMALAACLALFGCASPDPRYYSLERQPGPVLPSAPRTVIVRGVAVPRYLERDEIARESDDGRVRYSGNDWWSEPLRNMLQRVLAADLSQRLPSVEVLGTEALGSQGTAVLLAVDRFEPDGAGMLDLDGHLAIEAPGRDRVLRQISIRVPVPSRAMSAQIHAMSQALAQVADIAASVLDQRAGSTVSDRQPPPSAE